MTGLMLGSFDPLTNGHLDLIERAAMVCEKLIVCVAVNIAKKPMFEDQVRLGWLKESTAHLPNVECALFQGLAIEACHQFKADAFIRGLRNTQDFAYEQNMASVNSWLDPRVQTLCLFTSQDTAWISSSNVRELLAFGQDVKELVPAVVWNSLQTGK